MEAAVVDMVGGAFETGGVGCCVVGEIFKRGLERSGDLGGGTRDEELGSGVFGDGSGCEG